MALLNISVMTKDHTVQNAIFEINDVAAESLLSAIGAAGSVIPMEALTRIHHGIVGISDARHLSPKEVEALFRPLDPVVGGENAAGSDNAPAQPVDGGVDGAQGDDGNSAAGNGDGSGGNPAADEGASGGDAGAATGTDGASTATEAGTNVEQQPVTGGPDKPQE